VNELNKFINIIIPKIKTYENSYIEFEKYNNEIIKLLEDYKTIYYKNTEECESSNFNKIMIDIFEDFLNNFEKNALLDFSEDINKKLEHLKKLLNSRIDRINELADKSLKNEEEKLDLKKEKEKLNESLRLLNDVICSCGPNIKDRKSILDEISSLIDSIKVYFICIFLIKNF
jgi:hypothetical protein